jgi:hypothetical protein
MMQLAALRRKLDDPHATPKEKAEARLLLNITSRKDIGSNLLTICGAGVWR